MKEKVIALLQDTKMGDVERYNAAMAMYRTSELHSVPAAAFYNRSGFTAQNLKNLLYDVQKLHEITDADLLAKKPKKVQVKRLPDVVVALLQNAPDEVKAAIYLSSIDFTHIDKEAHAETLATYEAALLAFSEANLITFEAIDQDISNGEVEELCLKAIGDFHLPDELKEILVPRTGQDLTGAIYGTLAALGEKEAMGLKLREQFPFLEADDCPDKLKILVADRITAWKKYKEAHAELLLHADGEKPLTDGELYELAKEAIAKYQLNQLIWDELNYYKEHGSILGKHEMFADEVLQQKIDAMDVKGLMTRQKTLRSYVSREGKKLAKTKEAESKAKIQAKVDDWSAELKLVDARLEKQ